ncbi:MAG: histidinol-phosphate transaminase [Candidatus Omnitrophica bacterium]|nr:histidinol-phosphate transaminase [Candidatus Omnitrophota bacterium]
MNNIEIRENIKKLKPYQPGKPMEELQRELNIRLEDIIKLASNENPLGPSPKAARAFCLTSAKLNRYPDGRCFCLKEKLALKLAMSPDNIIIGNGSDEIIDMAVKAFAGEGDNVIVSEPAFLEYRIISTVRGCIVRSVAMKRRNKSGILSGFDFDIDAMLGAIDRRTRIIFLGNPDNPTGAYLNRKSLKNFIRRCPKNIVLLIDEAYREFVDKSDYVDTATLKGMSNVVTLRTFSKIYGLAGLRIGYAVSNSDIIGWMERVRQPFNANLPAQAAAEAALGDLAFVKRSRALNKKGMSYITKALKDTGCRVIESPANFVLFSLKGVSGNELFSRLLSSGIIIRDMAAYGLGEWARVSIGTMPQNKAFIKALKRSFK